jgi:hypothetical protein
MIGKGIRGSIKAEVETKEKIENRERLKFVQKPL